MGDVAKQEGSIRSVSGATLCCGMGCSKRGGVRVAGMLAQGLSKAAHTCSDMKQIVKALPSYASLMSSDSERSHCH